MFPSHVGTDTSSSPRGKEIMSDSPVLGTRAVSEPSVDERRIPTAEEDVRGFLDKFFNTTMPLEPFLPGTYPDDMDCAMIAEGVLMAAIPEDRSEESLRERFPFKDEYDDWLTMFVIDDVIQLMIYLHYTPDKRDDIRSWFANIDGQSGKPTKSNVNRSCTWFDKRRKIGVSFTAWLGVSSNQIPESQEGFKLFYHGTSWNGAHYFMTNGPRGWSPRQDFGTDPKFYFSLKREHALEWAGKKSIQSDPAIIVTKVPEVDWNEIQAESGSYYRLTEEEKWKYFVCHCRLSGEDELFRDLEQTDFIEGMMCANPKDLKYHGRPCPHTPTPRHQVALSGIHEKFWKCSTTDVFFLASQNE